MLDRARFAIDYVESATEDTESTGSLAYLPQAFDVRDQARRWWRAATDAGLAGGHKALALAVAELDLLAERAARIATEARTRVMH